MTRPFSTRIGSSPTTLAPEPAPYGFMGLPPLTSSDLKDVRGGDYVEAFARDHAGTELTRRHIRWESDDFGVTLLDDIPHVDLTEAGGYREPISILRYRSNVFVVWLAPPSGLERWRLKGVHKGFTVGFGTEHLGGNGERSVVGVSNVPDTIDDADDFPVASTSRAMSFRELAAQLDVISTPVTEPYVPLPFDPDDVP